MKIVKKLIENSIWNSFTKSAIVLGGLFLLIQTATALPRPIRTIHSPRIIISAGPQNCYNRPQILLAGRPSVRKHMIHQRMRSNCCHQPHLRFRRGCNRG